MGDGDAEDALEGAVVMGFRERPWGRCIVGECGFCGGLSMELVLTRMCGYPEGEVGRVAFICPRCEEEEDRLDGMTQRRAKEGDGDSDAA